MIDYICGKITELNPTRVVVENSGIGYSMEISLQTYSALDGKDDVKVFVHHHIQSSSDSEEYYGFSTKDERALFELLISVSGVGVNTARMILSSFSSPELRNAIIAEDVNAIKTVKGIGLKSAQRLVLELKDKVLSGQGSSDSEEFLFNVERSIVASEAETALITLGFSKANVQKVLSKLLKENPTAKVEELIKKSLSLL